MFIDLCLLTFLNKWNRGCQQLAFLLDGTPFRRSIYKEKADYKRIKGSQSFDAFHLLRIDAEHCRSINNWSSFLDGTPERRSIIDPCFNKKPEEVNNWPSFWIGINENKVFIDSNCKEKADNKEKTNKQVI